MHGDQSRVAGGRLSSTGTRRDFVERCGGGVSCVGQFLGETGIFLKQLISLPQFHLQGSRVPRMLQIVEFHWGSAEGRHFLHCFGQGNVNSLVTLANGRPPVVCTNTGREAEVLRA